MKTNKRIQKEDIQKWLGGFEKAEQRLCDHARAIRKNGRLFELELETICREISN